MHGLTKVLGTVVARMMIDKKKSILHFVIIMDTIDMK